MRTLTDETFDAGFAVVERMPWQESAEYYGRYRNRYEAVLRRYAATAPLTPQDVLEVGGGQLAVMAARIWNDRCSVADISTGCFESLGQAGVQSFVWNLARDAAPAERKFDFVFCSEVLEHLPVPGHVALTRLRETLKPGGHLILTTPNLYRLRNVAFLAMGRPIFDHFDLPSARGFGHVLEYSVDHLSWQFEQSEFSEVVVELQEFSHRPHRLLDRVASTAMAPLRRVPRFRDNLIAVARR